MSQHTGYAAILDGETTYGITFTDVEEYTQNGKYTALVLAGTIKTMSPMTASLLTRLRLTLCVSIFTTTLTRVLKGGLLMALALLPRPTVLKSMICTILVGSTLRYLVHAPCMRLYMIWLLSFITPCIPAVPC